MVKELSYDVCRNTCPDNMFTCESTLQLTPLQKIIGQDRAVRALQFGLKIPDKGFNVYVSGVPGTGRKTAIDDFLKEIAESKDIPDD